MGMLQQLLKTYERIETRFDPYKLKLSIIENNIFGVDLQPMAVEISRLRAWLSVIVDETDKNNIQPLPNLEFKFIAANSLLKLEDGQTDLFGDPDFDKKLQELRDKYFNARSPKRKQEYQDKYYKLTMGQGHVFEDERTYQLKSFDPFKNRRAADFFDANVMFGISNGFDAVIGNPPYIHFENMEKPLREFYKENAKKLGFTTYAARGDIYMLFYEKGIQLLSEGGFLSFITSNKWMRAGYGEKLRNFFVEKTNPIELIDLGAGVFESATVDTNILMLQREINHHQLKAITLGENGSENMSDYIRQHAVAIGYKKGESWTILSEIEQSIKKKIEAVGTPLKDWNISISYGIKTGLNEAFIIEKNKRDELIAADPKSAEIIRPILRGRDIKRYSYEFADLYVITAYKGINEIIEREYPAVFSHLKQFEIKLRQRGQVEGTANKPGSNQHHWTELDNNISLEKMDDLTRQKIVFSEMVQSPQFYLDNDGYMINDTITFISGKQLDYLVDYLNSSVIFNIYKLFYAGGGLGSKGIRVKKTFLEKLPVPQIEIHKKINPDLDSQIRSILSLSDQEYLFITNYK